MPVAQSITVSSDPSPVAITNEVPSGATRPSLLLSSWAPPGFAMKVGYLPDSPDVAGKALQSAALDAGTLPLVIKVHGVSMSDLQDNRRALEALFSQLAYTVTLTFGGVSETYDAFPAWPEWELDLSSITATATLSVPVNPMGA